MPGFEHRRRVWLSLAAGGLLSACGFRLRQAPQLGLQTLQLVAPAQSALAKELKRALLRAGTVRVIDADKAPPADAAVDGVLELLRENREQVAVGVNASGQIRELQLRMKATFRLRSAAGQELIPETELQQQRDVSYSETNALSKEIEIAQLYRDMQSDLVQQILRRLAALSQAQ